MKIVGPVTLQKICDSHNMERRFSMLSVGGNSFCLVGVICLVLRNLQTNNFKGSGRLGKLLTFDLKSRLHMEVDEEQVNKAWI